jgi:hypothetical protein
MNSAVPDHQINSISIVLTRKFDLVYCPFFLALQGRGGLENAT